VTYLKYTYIFSTGTTTASVSANAVLPSETKNTQNHSVTHQPQSEATTLATAAFMGK